MMPFLRFGAQLIEWKRENIKKERDAPKLSIETADVSERKQFFVTYCILYMVNYYIR
jgi:hypothetical protein